MPGSVLHVQGRFSPEEVLCRVSLEPYLIQAEGELVHPQLGPGSRVAKASSISVHVSRSCEIREQLADALAFLRRHSEDLRLVKERGLDSWIDFGYRSTVGVDGIAVQVVLLPNDLIEAASHAGVALMLSAYPGGRIPTIPTRSD